MDYSESDSEAFNSPSAASESFGGHASTPLSTDQESSDAISLQLLRTGRVGAAPSPQSYASSRHTPSSSSSRDYGLLLRASGRAEAGPRAGLRLHVPPSAPTTESSELFSGESAMDDSAAANESDLWSAPHTDEMSSPSSQGLPLLKINLPPAHRSYSPSQSSSMRSSRGYGGGGGGGAARYSHVSDDESDDDEFVSSRSAVSTSEPSVELLRVSRVDLPHAHTKDPRWTAAFAHRRAEMNRSHRHHHSQPAPSPDGDKQLEAFLRQRSHHQPPVIPLLKPHTDTVHMQPLGSNSPSDTLNTSSAIEMHSDASDTDNDDVNWAFHVSRGMKRPSTIAGTTFTSRPTEAGLGVPLEPPPMSPPRITHASTNTDHRAAPIADGDNDASVEKVDETVQTSRESAPVDQQPSPDASASSIEHSPMPPPITTQDTSTSPIHSIQSPTRSPPRQHHTMETQTTPRHSSPAHSPIQSPLPSPRRSIRTSQASSAESRPQTPRAPPVNERTPIRVDDSEVRELRRQLDDAKRELAKAKASAPKPKPHPHPHQMNQFREISVGLNAHQLQALEAIDDPMVSAADSAAVMVTIDFSGAKCAHQWLSQPALIIGPKHPSKQKEDFQDRIKALLGSGFDEEEAKDSDDVMRASNHSFRSSASSLRGDVEGGPSYAELLELADLEPEVFEMDALRQRLAAIEAVANGLEEDFVKNEQAFMRAKAQHDEQFGRRGDEHGTLMITDTPPPQTHPQHSHGRPSDGSAMNNQTTVHAAEPSVNPEISAAAALSSARELLMEIQTHLQPSEIAPAEPGSPIRSPLHSPRRRTPKGSKGASTKRNKSKNNTTTTRRPLPGQGQRPAWNARAPLGPDSEAGLRKPERKHAQRMMRPRRSREDVLSIW